MPLWPQAVRTSLDLRNLDPPARGWSTREQVLAVLADAPPDARRMRPMPAVNPYFWVWIAAEPLAATDTTVTVRYLLDDGRTGELTCPRPEGLSLPEVDPRPRADPRRDP